MFPVQTHELRVNTEGVQWVTLEATRRGDNKLATELPLKQSTSATCILNEC